MSTIYKFFTLLYSKLSSIGKDPYYLIIPFRLLKLFTNSIRVRFGKRSLIIPLYKQNYGLLVHKFNWKTELIRIILEKEKGDFLDIGANIGQTLMDFLYFENDVKYIGFEPNVFCANLLKDILASNNLNNCQVIPIGLADYNDLSVFYLDSENVADSGAGLLTSSGQKEYLIKKKDKSFVPCFQYDSIKSRFVDDRISLIKIDVEGAELLVLQGMRESLLQDRSLIICEVLHAGGLDLEIHSENLRNLENFLADVKYSIFQIVKTKGRYESLRHITKLTHFPVKRLTEANATECDYLFIPNEFNIESLNIPINNDSSNPAN